MTPLDTLPLRLAVAGVTAFIFMELGLGDIESHADRSLVDFMLQMSALTVLMLIILCLVEWWARAIIQSELKKPTHKKTDSQ